MGRAIRILGTLIVFLLLAVSLRLCSTHGHGNHRLFVRAQVVDAQTGKPLEGALVFVVQRELDTESRAYHRESALRYFDDPEEFALLDGDVLVTPLPISVSRTDARGAAEVWAARYHTVYFYPFWFDQREDGRLPRWLVVEHPKFQERKIPIPAGTAVEAAGSEWKSRIDLGTIELTPR
ncbi:MAG: hypothetical protein ACYTEG_02220 [Planctomycetota bacterium]